MRAALLLAAACVAVPAVASDVERGRAIWNFRCYFCHGYSGDAKTLASAFVNPRPRDFQSADPREFPLERIERAVAQGVPGTSMKPFRGILSQAEIGDVSAFLRDEFVVRRARNTAYHTVENGWPDHARHAAAFPYARGELSLDTPQSGLTSEQRRGRRLFMTTCITCHDRGRTGDAGGPAWERATAGR